MILKRVFDILISLFILTLAFPLLLFAVIAIRTTMGSPVFFRQTRPGKNRRPFSIVKLRTMHDRVDVANVSLSDDKRLTSLGKFLRATSIDELPELWNVLRGEMSLVGPRPLLMDYLPLYNERQNLRHTVRPGITGWAQINGRNAISWEEKLEFDAWYTENQSQWLDLKIIWRTIWKVLLRENINEPGHATQSKFTGSK
ncbi:sugar transferase [bacterium]|nr:sugar transferase [bacterium]